MLLKMMQSFHQLMMQESKARTARLCGTEVSDGSDDPVQGMALAKSTDTLLLVSRKKVAQMRLS